MVYTRPTVENGKTKLDKAFVDNLLDGIEESPTFADMEDAVAQAAASSRSVVTFAGLGDSLTESGAHKLNSTTWRNQGGSWFEVGIWLSGSRVRSLGVSAVGGHTIQQVHDLDLPAVLAAKPDYCTVLVGQNDLGSVDAQKLAVVQSILEKLVAVGTTPVVVVGAPTTTAANWFYLNDWLVNYAEREGLPVFDLRRAWVDPVTGIYRAGYTLDATHPTQGPGVQAGAEAFGAWLRAKFPGATAEHRLPYSNAGALRGANPLFLDPLPNGLVPGGAWAEESAEGTAVTEPDPSGVGNRVRVTKVAGKNRLQWNLQAIDLPANTDFELVFRLGTSVRAQGAFWTFNLFSVPDYTALVDLATLECDLADGTLVSVRGRSGATTQQVVPVVIIAAADGSAGAGGASVSLSQFRVRPIAG